MGNPTTRHPGEGVPRGYDMARHLKYSLAKDFYSATEHDRFLALSLAVRDRLVERWIETQQQYHKKNVKRVYYLSLEYLLGRSLKNNLVSLGVEDIYKEALKASGNSLEDSFEQEVDAGLGNGGLGRLAACFLDSLASMGYPAIGYGLRYEYGIFRQAIRHGEQVEEPDNWLRLGHPWEIARPEYAFPVSFGGRVEPDPKDPARFRWVDAHVVVGMPYDIPIVGFGHDNVNTLRLWSARSSREFDLEDFSQGDYFAAVQHKVQAENITKVLYPDDRVDSGRRLRLTQQYLLVACTLQDILRRHKADLNPIEQLPAKAAIQLNDTHPSLAVAELMRLLVDQERLPWDKAWEITRSTLAYTNHTLMAEALEQWPLETLQSLLPRHVQIIFEINRRFLDEVSTRWPGDHDRLRRMSLVAEEPPRRIRMAHLATVGSHSINGVSAIHSDLVKTQLLRDFHQLWPERFNNKTNGITPRRWLRGCNPGLASLVTETLGTDRWLVDLDRLEGLATSANDAATQTRFLGIKRDSKAALARHVEMTLGVSLDPDSIFDVQVKRLHEYKRQLLNILHVAHLYRRLREEPGFAPTPRTFLFAAKAAPAYVMAKRIIRLIHEVGRALDSDPKVGGRLRVVFLPDYRVSLAERIVPAADVSEQISTAGTEASGTSNMKFALNGALTVGTLDGANIEIREAVGADNFFEFGLSTPEVQSLQATQAAGRNVGWEIYERDASIRATLDFLFSGHFGGKGLFEPIREAILLKPDKYLHLADLGSYAAAHERVDALYRDRNAWARKALLNVAHMGRFSSDRTIRDYAQEIWKVDAVPISMARKSTPTMIQYRKVLEADLDLHPE